MKGLSQYTKFTTFYEDCNEEPESYKWGKKLIDICKTNNIPYKTTSPSNVPECTIWIKYGYVNILKNIIK